MPIEEAKRPGAQALFGRNTATSCVLSTWADIPSSSAVVRMRKIHPRSWRSRSFQRAVWQQACVELEALTSKDFFIIMIIWKQKMGEAKTVKATPENLGEKIGHLLSENKALGPGSGASLKEQTLPGSGRRYSGSGAEDRRSDTLAAELPGS